LNDTGGKSAAVARCVSFNQVRLRFRRFFLIFLCFDVGTFLTLINFPIIFAKDRHLYFDSTRNKRRSCCSLLLNQHLALDLVVLMLRVPNHHIRQLFFHPHRIVFLVLATRVQISVFQKLAQESNSTDCCPTKYKTTINTLATKFSLNARANLSFKVHLAIALHHPETLLQLNLRQVPCPSVTIIQ
jgi:hypothetical protein